MLTKTSERAIQLLMYLALYGKGQPVSPGNLASQLGASSSYMAKITGLLVKAGILQAQRGAHGGVLLNSAPGSIPLLAVIEACQGRILGDYCTEDARLSRVCAFHQAMHELHQATVGVLSRWTIADLAAKPLPAPSLRGKIPCRAACVVPKGEPGKGTNNRSTRSRSNAMDVL